MVISAVKTYLIGVILNSDTTWPAKRKNDNFELSNNESVGKSIARPSPKLEA